MEEPTQHSVIAEQNIGHEMELVRRILAGERELFHDLIRPYEKKAFFAAFSMLRVHEESEDVVQEAMMKAYKALGNFRGESKFSTWLMTIVLNEARGRLRHDRLQSFTSLDETPEEDDNFAPAVISDWREVPLEALERLEVRQLIHEAIAKLPAIYREVFLLRDIEEYSIQEAATELAIGEPLVKVRLLRARLMMQKFLAPKLKAGRGSRFKFLRKGVGASWF